MARKACKEWVQKSRWARTITYLEVSEPNLPICVCKTEDMVYEWLALPCSLGDSKNLYKHLFNDLRMRVLVK